MSGGWNPMTGRDTAGPAARPPMAPYGAPLPATGQAYIPHIGGPGYGYGNIPSYGSCASTYSFANPVVYGQPVTGAPYTYVCQPNGANNIFPRTAQAYPTIDPAMPAAQMANSSGGVGCEPGYNYFFAAETTKCHIFYSETAPWQLPANAVISFKASHIPCNTKLSELLKGFGCTNDTPKKNKCTEIVPGGNGKWYKGVQFNGGQKDFMNKTVGELGWDKSRSGHQGEKPVVCLWFCKD